MTHSKIDILHAKVNVLILSLNIILFDNKTENLQELGNVLCKQLPHLEEGGLWLWNYQTGEVYYSPKFCETLGYEYKELGTGFAGFDLADKEQFSKGEKMINDLIENNSIEPYINDITYSTKLGEKKLVQCVGSIFYKDNLPYLILGTHRIK